MAKETYPVTAADVTLPRRDREAHKGDFGRAVILGGSVGYSGAPVIAAQAAVRSGAGLVTVLVPAPIWWVAAAKLDGAMPWPLPSDHYPLEADSIALAARDRSSGALSKAALTPALEKLRGAGAVLIGPGLSREPDAAWVARELAWEVECPLVLDADGINALEGHIDVLDSRQGRLTVLTPHDGEFARLTGAMPGEDREAAARDFAAAHHCVLVLKGHRTITAFPDGRCYRNTTGNPGMARGGSGDALAGLLVSMLAQGFPPEKAAPWSVWLHGRAGDLAAEEKGEYGMTVSDLIAAIPRAMKEQEEG